MDTELFFELVKFDTKNVQFETLEIIKKLNSVDQKKELLILEFTSYFDSRDKLIGFVDFVYNYIQSKQNSGIKKLYYFANIINYEDKQHLIDNATNTKFLEDIINLEFIENALESLPVELTADECENCGVVNFEKHYDNGKKVLFCSECSRIKF